MSYANLRPRVLTAAGLAGGVLILVAVVTYWRNLQWLLGAFSFIVVGMSAGEFARIASDSFSERLRGASYLGMTLCPSVLVLALVTPAEIGGQGLFVSYIPALLALSALIVFSWAGFHLMVQSAELLEEGTRGLRNSFPGGLLIGFGGAALILLTFVPQAPLRLLWLLLVVCTNDTAAYFVGSRIGGPKLAPVVSPKKTWSGSIGGVVVGTLVGGSTSFLLSSNLSVWWIGLLAAFVVCLAQLGDLLKSYVKRVHGVKDTGTILPGHGGVLDRVDGILMASPPILLFLVLEAYFS